MGMSGIFLNRDNWCQWECVFRLNLSEWIYFPGLKGILNLSAPIKLQYRYTSVPKNNLFQSPLNHYYNGVLDFKVLEYRANLCVREPKVYLSAYYCGSEVNSPIATVR